MVAPCPGLPPRAEGRASHANARDRRRRPAPGRAGRARPMTGYRLPAGGRIDRRSILPFTWDGQTYHGYPGDTLASALLAKGVRVIGRSFKYHRPRGIVTAGPEEPCALVTLGTGARRDANMSATAVELFAGLRAESQNRWPSLRFDLMAASGLFASI